MNLMIEPYFWLAEESETKPSRQTRLKKMSLFILLDLGEYLVDKVEQKKMQKSYF